MTYSALLQQLLNINLFNGIKLGLNNVQRLQQLLHFPDHTFQTIHVAGTNGKGSVSTKIAHTFKQAGYRVGLYTSPHISSFRERIQINGTLISEEAVESLLPSLFQLVETEKIPATFFELTTFLAFLYFVQEKVEIAVIETGLGGRLDATNIVQPCLSIITSISLDHVEILGSTLESIAREKGGIIKEKIPIIIGPHVPLEIIQSIAEEKASPCIQVQSDSALFEIQNRQIARAALHYLAPSFPRIFQFIEKGLEAKQPCRFEIIPGPLPIILDVAHNPDGIQHLFQMVDHYYPKKPLRLVFGLSKNKDLKSCLKLIASRGQFFHLVKASNGRGASISDLHEQLSLLGIPSSQILSHDSIHAGVCLAKERALQQGEILVICGSFFIMSQVRQAFGIEEPCDAMDLNER